MMESNPLLEMLKSAAGGPPKGSNTSTPPAPAGQAGNDVKKTTSPPPTFQAVSIDDLFKSISSPPGGRFPGNDGSRPPSHPAQAVAAAHGVLPTPAALSKPSTAGIVDHSAGTSQTSAANTPAPHTDAQSPPGHTAKLLGMLSLGAGSGSSGASPDTSRPTSGPKTPSGAGQGEAHRRTSLLNVLRSPQSATSPALAEPVITHPTPATPAGPTPFDFVSPFDAFEKRKPRTLSTAASHTPSAQSQSTTPSSPAKRGGAGSPLKSGASAASNRRDAPSSHKSSEAAAPATKTHSRRPSSSAAKKDAHAAFLASKLNQGKEGSGPMALAAGGTTIDMSEPNTSSLVNAPNSFRITPATIMRAESTVFSRGRTVGAANGWIAYTLSRGRVRLIDMATGARTLIQLEATGPVVDIAVSNTALAVVMSDRSVNAYRVPESWAQDDPDCPLIFRLPPIASGAVPAEKALGEVNQVEWVRREDGSEQLAIGGTEGAVIVNPSGGAADPATLLSSHRVLKTSGAVVQFCLNATHQAIGLISSSGYFCLYSVASLNKVWHRQLPSSNTAAPLSSVRFCEANILVGRASDTMFDLVQITYELAVISTLKFDAPHDAAFGQAVYDSARETLFVSQFARGSVYAFHYVLKGAQPLRGVAGTDAASTLAFDAVAEFPAEPIVSFVVCPTSTNDDAELLFASQTGISQAHVDKSLLPPRPKAAAEKKPLKGRGKKVNDREPRASSKKEPDSMTESSEREAASDSPQQRRYPAPISSPSIATAPSHPAPEPAPQSVTAAPAARNSSSRMAQGVLLNTNTYTVGGPLSAFDLHRALKNTEDKLATQFKQMLQIEMSRDEPRDQTSGITDAITNHLQANLPWIVQQEVQRVLPGAVQSGLREHAHSAIQGSMQGVQRDIERAIAPVIPRALGAVVQPAVERAVRDAVNQALVPALDDATTRVYDQLAADLKTEMVQIRKDIVAEQGETLGATNEMLHHMSATIESLQRQVAALAARSPAGPTPAPAAPAGPTPTHVARSFMSPPAASHTPMAAAAPQTPMYGLEEAFLQALQRQTTDATLALLGEYASRTDAILPQPPNRSPLSQAVILTLVHRLSSAIVEVSPHDGRFQTLATWLRRAIELLDPRDPGVASYLPRVAGVVTRDVSGVIDGIARHGETPLNHAHLNVLRSSLDALRRKQA